MQLPVYNLAGEPVSEIDVSDSVFLVPFNGAVVHQAMVRQMANARQGTASTKTRGEVAYSTRKLFRQKHTGNARAGSRRSPLRRGGGVTFGPQPRSYRQAMPRKMRRLALRCLLSAKAGDGELKVVEQLTLDQPRTREMVKILSTLGAEESALIVTEAPEGNVIKSAQNLSGIKTIPAGLLNVVDLLSYRILLMTVAAVRRVEQLWGQEAPRGEVSASV
ncbi:MAG TPA: 50S ribosomal protein L4 [Dehalococcoidia bacterium]|nr:50S ribosomal protein L4 [Dehalococcoidia bacterium]